jgi:hypothetical protein
MLIKGALKYLSLLVVVLTVTGCTEEESVTQSMSWNDYSIGVALNELKYDKLNQMTLVYGEVAFNPIMDSGIVVNLTCLVLRLGEAGSEKVYVNSVAHILTDKFPLSPESNLVRLYWRFLGEHTTHQLKEIKVEIKQGCIVIS